MPEPDAPPNVFAYLDYRAFLRDWFEARKAVEPRFSHRAFAARAGYRSSSVLHAVMKGTRNLGAEAVESFADAVELEDDARHYFRALVTLDQARTDEERNEAWETISAERRFREARRLEGEGFRFLSNWYLPAIHQLAVREDFQADPAWITARIRPAISEEQAAQALESLTTLGLLVEVDGRLSPHDASVVTPHEVQHLAARNYHRQMSGLAGDSVADVPPEARHLLGVTVAVPEDLVPELKHELNRMQARLLDLCDRASGERPATNVYQINLQLVPLSHDPEAT